MKIEIETRFLGIDKKDLLSKLNVLKAVDKGEIKLYDVIFFDKDLRWQKENRVVRLRKKNDVVTLVHKINKEQVVDSAQEIELTVSDFEETKAFLEAIGLIAYRNVEKYRHTFVLDGVTLDIDTWPKIPSYVELEGESVEDLKSVAGKLGLVWGDRFDGDPKHVYKKYGFDLDKVRSMTFDKFE